MKIRKGFVTNSSSSSFIIAVKNNKESDALKLIDLIFAPHANCINDKDELDCSYMEQHSWGEIDTIEKILKENKYLTSIYSDSLDLLLKNYKIYSGSLDYEISNFMYGILKQSEQLGLIKIIEIE